MNESYLDNSATTRVSGEVCAVISDTLARAYGNPSSLHGKGLEAELVIRGARETLARLLGCAEKEVYFTSGGTEANNMAVFGAAHALRKRGNRIVTTAYEHPSVLESVQELEREGFDCVYIAPDDSGRISAERVLDAVDENTILVSVMHVNNETGAVAPVARIAKGARQKSRNVLIHCDAVQSFCKLPFTVGSLGADLLTVTAHKLHGPKGIGALYKAERARLLPLLHGGEQQRRLRPGTENVAYISGFAHACKLAHADMKQNLSLAQGLAEYLRGLLAGLDGVVYNSPRDALPYILNFSTGKVRSETMLHYLEEQGVYVSSGSACAKGRRSHVLAAMGLTGARLDTALRVGFSRENTKEDCDRFCAALQEGCRRLAHA